MEPISELKDVSYRYADNDEYVIKHVNLIFYYREGVVILENLVVGRRLY